MNGLLAAEFFKLRKRWMPYVIAIIMGIIIALVFWGIGTSNNRNNLFMPRGFLIALYMACGFSAFLWPVLGGSWAGNEYGWGTVRLVLSRRPSRSQWTLAAVTALLTAGLLALLVALLVGGLAGTVVALLTGNSIFSTNGLQSNYALIILKMFLAGWLILSFYLILGYAAGTVFRSGAVGIGLGIGLTVAQLVLTGIFVALGSTWKTVAEHLPYSYTNALPSLLAQEGTTGRFLDRATGPGVGECVIGLLVYCAVLIAVTLVVVRVRDVTS